MLLHERMLDLFFIDIRIRPVSSKRKTVKIRRGPAAVTGDHGSQTLRQVTAADRECLDMTVGRQ